MYYWQKIMSNSKDTLIRRLTTFTLLAFIFSWGYWIPLVIRGQLVYPGMGWPTHLFGLLGTSLAAFITALIFEGKTNVMRLIKSCGTWRIGKYWLSLLAIIVSVVIALGITGFQFTTEELFTYSGVSATWSPILIFLFVLFVNGFGEEIGWRGYLADGLLEKYSIIKSALITALIWALWHIPLFWLVASFNDFGIGNTLGWFIGLVAGSILLVWLYHRSNKSILLVALWHTLFNFTSATQATAQKIAPVTTTIVITSIIAIIWSEIRQARANKTKAS